MRLNREILRLALPSILANITVPLVGMVDIAVVGHLGSTEGLSGAALIGGISVGTMLFDLLYWNFAFLRTGTGGLTAQAYGRGDDTGSILGRALRIALISGVTLIALQWTVVWLAFMVVDCSPEVRELATRYFHIRIWAAPATLSLFAFKGWFIGLQDTLRPMLVDLWMNFCNILLSAGLGFGLIIGGDFTLLPGLGFSGVAWGTVIAQWTSLLLAILVARKYLSLSHLLTFLVPKRNENYPENPEYQQVTNHSSSSKDHSLATEDHSPATEGHSPAAKDYAPSFFTLNRDLFLRSLGMIAVYIGFTVISASLGDLMLAVSTILMKLLMLFSYFTDGFAFAGEALTGRFIGERSPEGVRATVRGTFAWGFGLAAAFMLLYGLGGVPALRLMTSDAAVVEAGRAFLPWLLLMPLIGCPAFTWDGIYIGATASGDLRHSTTLCALGFFAVWFAGRWLLGTLPGTSLPSTSDSLTPEAGLHLLMAAYFMHLAVRTLYQTLRYRPAVLWPHFGRGR